MKNNLFKFLVIIMLNLQFFPSHSVELELDNVQNKIEDIKSMKATGNNQKEILFIRGNAISGAPIIIGTNQLPKPPIIAGITMKNIMISP